MKDLFNRILQGYRKYHGTLKRICLNTRDFLDLQETGWMVQFYKKVGKEIVFIESYIDLLWADDDIPQGEVRFE
jgi:hypothetical protein